MNQMQHIQRLENKMAAIDDEIRCLTILNQFASFDKRDKNVKMMIKLIKEYEDLMNQLHKMREEKE